MSKLNLPIKNNISIISHHGKRVRVLCKELNQNSDESSLEATILHIDNVEKVRVNKGAKSIIFTYTKDLDNILSSLKDITIEKLKKQKDEPSKAEIYKSSAVLAGSMLLSNTTFKSLASLYAAFPLLKDGTKDFFQNGLTSKMLEALAVGVSLARKDYTAANGTNLLINLGEYIEQSTVYKSDDLIKQLARPSLSEVWIEVLKNGKKELKLISAKDLKIGDIVVASTGDSIEVDGYIVDGSADINQVSMTGEAEPVHKERGDRVLSGTIVEEGQVKIWAENVGQDTATSRIKEYIQASLNEKSQIGLKATKLADKLVPVTLSLAGLSYLINKNTMSVAAVLQADYSCALKLATPVAFKTSIGKSGKEGILIKGAKAIEALAKTDTFIFDKTGTLTHGNLSLVEVNSFTKEFTSKELLNLTASAEEHYVHPVAEAIVKAAKEQGFHHIHHDEVEFIVAHGVKTSVKGKELIIGSRHFLEDDEMICFKNYEQMIKDSLRKGLTLLYIGYNGKLVGTIGMKDEMRENSKSTILRLRELGVKEIIMLTGDVEEKAKEVADELGIDKFYANCLPTDKASIIEELKNMGKNIAFIGDGINDAPSLVKADVGISMKKGADIAKATADISLLKDDIEFVARIKEIANKTMQKINTNFMATVIIDSGILLGATLGKFSPITTALLHNGTTIGLLINSMQGVKVDEK